MLLVKTFVAPSAIQGLGVFAAQTILEDTPVWRFSNNFDHEWYLHELAHYSPELFEYVKRYGNPVDERGKYLICFDDARFMNHSNKPNISCKVSPNYAIRRIRKGEEIICDYREFVHGFDGFKEKK